MYICPTCMHVCMYACMYVQHACMHVCMYACMHVCMYVCMHVCMYVCMHACMWCTYVCMYVFVCFCCEVCREDKAGRGYLGQVNTTVSGLQCQPWSSTTPHVPKPSYTDNKFSDGSRAAAENYCRNPDLSYLQGVWCYTMDQDVPWEKCDVPECGNI